MAKSGKPSKIVVGTTPYQIVVFRVESFRSDGRPDELSIVYEDDVVELSHSTTVHFHTGYMQPAALKPNPETADPDNPL